MTFEIVAPSSEQEFKRYYHLRWSVMRKPFQLPPGSEKDEFEQFAHHRMILDDKGQPIACGRLYHTSCDEAHIRFIAVAAKWRGKGLGSAMVQALEDLARELGVRRLMMNVRPQAQKFYQRHGFHGTGEGPTHFGRIHHLQMLKNLSPLPENTRHADWCKQVQALWREQIPISEQMGIRIVQYTGKRFEVRAAFNANINPHGTLFAGSGYSLAALAGWGLVYMMLKEHDLNGTILLARAEMEYQRPVNQEPIARANYHEVQGSMQPLRQGKSTRLEVQVIVFDKDGDAARFVGEFVVKPLTESKRLSLKAG